MLPGASSQRAQEERQGGSRQPGARVLARGAAAARLHECAGTLPRARARAPRLAGTTQDAAAAHARGI